MEILIMEKSRKSLKFMSEIILICLTFSFIRTILEVFLVKVDIENIPTQFLIIAKIMKNVISLPKPKNYYV